MDSLASRYRLLRDAEIKRKAHAILAGTDYPKWLEYISLFVMGLLTAFLADEYFSSRFTRILIAATPAAVIWMQIELWATRRKLNALIQLLSRGENLSEKRYPNE